MPSTSSFNSSVYAVIMAGGAGARLWPESRADRPKPFLPLAPNGESLLRATYERIAPLTPPENQYVVAGRRFEALTRRELPEIPPQNVLLEPCGRDTALCVAWSAFEIARRDPDAVIIVLASDHLVRPEEPFRKLLTRAVELVRDDPTRIVTLGIRPREPATAFGYVERGEALDGFANAFRVREFEEKPNPQKNVHRTKPSKLLEEYGGAFQDPPDPVVAREFLSSGRYLWNAGLFVWRATTILQLLRRFEPELASTLDEFTALAERKSDWRASADFDAVFARAKRISIDYAVLERAPNVVALDSADEFEWSDLGSFDALAAHASERADERGNLAQGARLVAVDASNAYVRVSGGDKKIVALSGIDDLLVVETKDALLIAKKGQPDALKKLVEQIKLQDLDEFL